MKISLLITIALSMLMVGCGGGSSNKSSKSSSSVISSTTSIAPSSVAIANSSQANSSVPILTGVFLDAAVENIGYRTATQQGFTNSNGEFNYRAGELITFFIGSLELPVVMARDIITPMDIANTQTLTDSQLVNILRLLQSLDADGNLTNGIQITAAAIAAGATLDFTLAPEIFAQLPAVQSLLQAAGGVNKELISTEQAIAHFLTTLELINGPSSSSSSQSSDVTISSSASSEVVAPSSSSASSEVVAPSSSSASSDVVALPSSSASSEVVAPSSSSASSGVVVPSSSSASSEIVAPSSSSVNSEAPVSSSSAAGNSSESGNNSSASNSSEPIDLGALRPAKIEGFAAYAGVTGGAGGPIITVSTGTELNAALCGVRKSNRTAPVIIMVNGTINHGNTTAEGCDTQADVIEIKKTSNISIIGVGTNALFDEIGIHVRDATNIIIQNVHIRNVKKSGSPTSNGGDAIGMETNVDRVWIDHNWLEASGGEKDGYDSLLDMKSGVTNVTVSYNLYNDSSRAGLVGFNDNDTNNNITFHHNWYKNIEQRTPLVRNALVHVYNNYWSNPTQTYMIHAINSRSNAKVLVESNYFYNVNNPLIASKDSPTPGCWQTNNDNTVLPSIYYSRTVENGQAHAIPAVVNGQLQSNCEVTVPYTVVMDAANDVPAIVMANAGVGKIGNGGSSNSSDSNSSSSNANSSYANSSSSGPASGQSSSAGSSLGSGVSLSENFNVDKATLFSAVYQSISTDSSAALYFITGGGSGITVIDNQLSIVAGRFSIGNRPPRTATTAGDISANGDFDLSRPYRISFTVMATSGTGKVQVYVDNNTTSVANSMHGANSRVFDAAANTLTVGQLIEITPSVGTPTSFIAFRTESSTGVTIDNLRVEYLDEGASGSSESSSSVASSIASSEEASSSVSSVSSSEAESSSSESSVSSEESSSSSVASSIASSEEASSSVSSVSSSEAESSSSESSASSEEASSSSVASSIASSEEASSSVSSVSSSEAESSSSESSASSAVPSSSSAASSESSSEESSTSSSSSSTGIVNIPLPLTEDFNNVVDATGFFSVAYKALATEETPFYHGLSGTPVFANGEMTLGNARFTLGNITPTVATSSTDTVTTGEFDLSQAYRISFCVKAAQGAGNFQVFVDNNTTGQGNSTHGNPSRIYSGSASSMTVGQRIVINSSVGSSTSFIGLRAESSAQVTIDDLWIGYQADTSTEPAAGTCVAPAPVAPNTPMVTEGDKQLSVNWSAVSGATSYEVIYHTVDSVDGAIAFENNPVVGTSAVITGLTNDTTYFVFVRAVNTNGSSEYSVSASGTPVADDGEEPPVSSWVGEAVNIIGTSGTAPSGSIISSSNSAITIAAGGGSSDSGASFRFYFAHKKVTAPFTFTARLTTVSTTGGGAFARFNNASRYGVMVLENLNPVANFANVARFTSLEYYTGGNAGAPTLVGSRSNKINDTSGTRSRSDVPGMNTASTTANTWLRVEVLEASGVTRFKRSYSTDGVNFTETDNTAFAGSAVPAQWHVGVFGAPQDDLTLAFDNISIVQN